MATPARIKQANGSYRANLDGKASEDKYRKLKAIPQPPDFVFDDVRLKSLWYGTCKALLDVDLLLEIILPQLERYLKLQHVFNEAYDNIIDNGIMSPSRPELANPAVGVMLRTYSALLKFEDRQLLSISRMARMNGNAVGLHPSEIPGFDPFQLEVPEDTEEDD